MLKKNENDLLLFQIFLKVKIKCIRKLKTFQFLNL